MQWLCTVEISMPTTVLNPHHHVFLGAVPPIAALRPMTFSLDGSPCVWVSFVSEKSMLLDDFPLSSSLPFSHVFVWLF